MPSKDNYNSAKLQDFNVREWGKHDSAMLLVEWYNNLSSRDANLTVEEVMRSAELQTFESQEDAQKFLDYLISLLDEEMGLEAIEISPTNIDSNDNTMVEENSAEQDGASQSQTSEAFWNDP